MKTKTAKTREWVMQGIFTACACISILAVALICIFLFANGLPTIFKIGPLNFLLGTTWKPGNDIYGILPMILGSIYVTAGAIIVGVPIGLFTAVYMSKFASPAVNKVMLPAVQLLAGIPSVVYGFFGMIVLVPAAKSGVLSAVILGIGRAIGETMAVVMVAGNQTWMPKGLFQGLRTMTSNIVIEMGYAADLHREALIATGVVLFVFILLINLCFSIVKGGSQNA